MKKSLFTFFIPIFLSLLFAFFFACNYNFKWPKEIEIKKETPVLRFDTNIDEIELMEVFGDLDFDFGHDEDVNIIDCTNTETLTLIIYANLFDGEVGGVLPDELDYILDLPDDTKISTTGMPALVSTSSPIKIEIPDFTGTPLKGFNFKPLQTRLYLSGDNDNFLNLMVAEVSISSNSFGRSQPSGLNGFTEYSGQSLPPSSNTFEITFDEDFDVTFSVSLLEGREVEAGWLQGGHSILVELAIWFPFEFIAGSDVDNMKLPFDDLFSGDDLFGRESSDDESFLEMIENISLEAQLSANPFPDAIFVVENPDPYVHLESSITGRILSISIDKEHLGYPFKPEFSIKFEEGDEIIVPRVFSLEKLGFKAKLRYVIDVPKFKLPENFIPESLF